MTEEEIKVQSKRVHKIAVAIHDAIPENSSISDVMHALTFMVANIIKEVHDEEDWPKRCAHVGYEALSMILSAKENDDILAQMTNMMNGARSAD